MTFTLNIDETLLKWGGVIIGVFLYLLVARLSAWGVYCFIKGREGGEFEARFTGVCLGSFWPVVLPILAVVWFVTPNGFRREDKK